MLAPDQAGIPRLGEPISRIPYETCATEYDCQRLELDVVGLA